MKKVLLFIWEVLWRTVIIFPALLSLNDSGNIKINLFGLAYAMLLIILYKTKVFQSIIKYVKIRLALKFIIKNKIPLRIHDTEELFLIYDNVDKKVYQKYFRIGNTYSNTIVYDIIGRVSDLMNKYNL